MQEGRFYLFACPFFWTWIGRYVRHVNFQEVVIADATYTTHTGATFDVLTRTGFVPTSKHHPVRTTLVLADGSEIPGGAVIPAQGPKLAWEAPTPWVQRKGAGK